METATRGKVIVPALIESIKDLLSVEEGRLRPDQVHRVEVTDATVDTGATFLCMPKRLIAQLGLTPFSTRRVRTTAGSRQANIYGPVRLTVQGRQANVDVGEVDDDCPVLIGQVPLEILDFLVDPTRQRLIGNPAHGGEQMFEIY